MKHLLVLSAILGVEQCCYAASPMIPINDLGSGTYLGLQGGLYPGGTNQEPAAHAAIGVTAANTITPLNTAGQPSTNGKYVFLFSVGLSNTSQEWCGDDSSLVYQPYSLMGQAAAHPAVNHSSMVIFNGARGGQDASTWDNFSDANYSRVASDLQTNSLSEKQVEAVWLKVANPQPTVSLPNVNADANILVTQMGNIVRSMKLHYPNLKTVFVTSRIYAGYATTTQNPEPYAYETGFAVKRLIGAQITQTSGGAIDPLAGDLSISSGIAPWITWGPYPWANGLIPRSDGLTWASDEFNNDGTHPNTAGRQKVATMLMQQFVTSPFSQKWFLSTLPGDSNFDGKVNALDFNALATNFGQSGKLWADGDYNYDGVVNSADFSALASNFNQTFIPAAPAFASIAPEPISLLIPIAAIPLIRRRRR